MRTVRDDEGRRYHLLQESTDSSLVRDVDTGETRYLENDRLELESGESPLETAAHSVPEPARRVLTAVRDERSLGLLVELVDRGPLPVRTLLTAYDYCESDLHALLVEFQYAGLVEERSVGDERGYGATTVAQEGVSTIRNADVSQRS